MSLGSSNVLNRMVHPDLHGSLDLAYPAVVTIQEPTESQGDDYSIERTWTAVSDLTAVNGILAAARADEVRRAALTGVTITHVLDLQSYHPEILPTHRALVRRVSGDTAETFNITGVKHDSQGRSTRLELEQVSH